MKNRYIQTNGIESQIEKDYERDFSPISIIQIGRRNTRVPNTRNKFILHFIT